MVPAVGGRAASRPKQRQAVRDAGRDHSDAFARHLPDRASVGSVNQLGAERPGRRRRRARVAGARDQGHESAARRHRGRGRAGKAALQTHPPAGSLARLPPGGPLLALTRTADSTAELERALAARDRAGEDEQVDKADYTTVAIPLDDLLDETVEHDVRLAFD